MAMKITADEGKRSIPAKNRRRLSTSQTLFINKKELESEGLDSCASGCTSSREFNSSGDDYRLTFENAIVGPTKETPLSDFLDLLQKEKN
jgi:hypothetical protein